jgi:hypothetical protein
VFPVAEESLISPEDRRRIIKDLLERTRVARLEWRRADIEAKHSLAVADARMRTAEGTLALHEAKRLLTLANSSQQRYQALMKALNNFLLYGKRPAS